MVVLFDEFAKQEYKLPPAGSTSGTCKEADFFYRISRRISRIAFYANEHNHTAALLAYSCAMGSLQLRKIPHRRSYSYRQYDKRSLVKAV